MHALKVLLIICLFSLTACGGGGGGGNNNNTSIPTISNSSSSVSSTSTSVPQNLSAVSGDTSVGLNWSPVAGATSYNIYFATEANIIFKNISAFQNNATIKNANPPYLVTGLQNNKTYYFVVTAVIVSQESAQSAEVSATPTAEDVSRQPTPQEVLVVELINRARFDPAAEAARYGIGLNDGITGTPITADRKAPLAHNLFLIESARSHSQWMLDADVFSHTGMAGSTPTERMMAAGYVFAGNWSSGENIAWAGNTSNIINLTQYAMIHHEGLFKSPGHRVNILGTSFREIGVGQKQGYFISNETNYLSSILTENFARSGTSYYLTGVVYDDKNGNKFYDVGEGLDRVTISINGRYYPVYSSGAYAIPLNNGTYDLVITGGPLGNIMNYRVQINNTNLKLDIVKTGSATEVVTW
jgi:hypothetical protein